MREASAAPGRALIVGGSMGGLLAGLFLLRNGWKVDIFERSWVELTACGAGIVSHSELHRLLTAIGLPPGEDHGVQISERILLDRAGQVTHSRRAVQMATSWNQLFRVLRAAFPSGHYHIGRRMTDVALFADGVSARFDGGNPQDADILIGADGLRSSARELLAPLAQPRYSGYVAWRGVVDEQLFPNNMAAFLERFAFYLPPGEQILGYPIAGPNNDLRPGHRSYNFVWYRQAEAVSQLPALLTDASGRVHTFSIPPPSITPDVIAVMRDAARRLLPAHFRFVVEKAPTPFLQPIYDLETPEMVFGRVALLGDAAFVARPHVGAGVTKAAQDAETLAACLTARPDDSVSALHQYGMLRSAVGQLIVARGRALGSYIRSRFDSQAERALAAHHVQPDAVLSETASMDFLNPVL